MVATILVCMWLTQSLNPEQSRLAGKHRYCLCKKMYNTNNMCPWETSPTDSLHIDPIHLRSLGVCGSCWLICIVTVKV